MPLHSSYTPFTNEWCSNFWTCMFGCTWWNCGSRLTKKKSNESCEKVESTCQGSWHKISIFSYNIIIIRCPFVVTTKDYA